VPSDSIHGKDQAASAVLFLSIDLLFGLLFGRFIKPTVLGKAGPARFNIRRGLYIRAGRFMKDMKEPTTKPAGSADKKERIVELTPDMELRDAKKSRIIDLANARPVPSAPGDSLQPEPISKTPTPETPEPMPAESVETSSEPPAMGNAAGIEADIDAAFDAMQAEELPPQPQPEVTDEPASDAFDLQTELAERSSPSTTSPPSMDEIADPGSEIAGMSDEVEIDPTTTALAAQEEPTGLPEMEQDDVIELTETSDISEPDAMLGESTPQKPEDQEEDLIELTDLVEPAMGVEAASSGASSAEQAPDDDEIIELVDIVDPQTLAMPLAAAGAISLSSEEEDDDIIELTDRVDPEELKTARASLSEPEDEDIIELTEVQPYDDAPIGSTEQEGDQVIRLDRVLAHVRKNETKIKEELSQELESVFADGPDASSGRGDDVIDLNEVREAIGGATELTDKELEDLIERIIRTKYAETIERHIASVVEKVVTREMESLKRSMMEDQGEDD
jgi:hypothetical protein